MKESFINSDTPLSAPNKRKEKAIKKPSWATQMKQASKKQLENKQAEEIEWDIENAVEDRFVEDGPFVSVQSFIILCW